MSYHLRRSDREIEDTGQLQSVMKNGKYAVVGLSKDNEPYVVALNYAYDREANALYFHGAKEGRKIDFMRSNPRAVVLIVDDGGFDAGICDYSYKSLVIHGTIGFVDDPREADRAIRLMIEQLEHENPDHFYAKLVPGKKSYDNLQVLKMNIDSMTGKARKLK